MNLLLSRYWLHLVAAAAIAIALGLLVKAIRDDAIQDNEQVWQDRMKDMDEKATKAIADVRAASVQLAITAQTNTKTQTNAINAAVSVLKVTNGKAPSGTFVKPNSEGNCEFTPDYSESILKIRNSLPRN
jgi:hypothetical protein